MDQVRGGRNLLDDVTNIIDIASGLAEKSDLGLANLACLLQSSKMDGAGDIRMGLQLSYSCVGQAGEILSRLHALHANLVEQILVLEGYGEPGFISGEEAPPQ